MRVGLAGALALFVASGCDDARAPVPPAPAAASVRATPPVPASATVSATASVAVSAGPAPEASPLVRVQQRALVRLERTEGALRADLAGGGRVVVVAATKQSPLAAHGPAAHFAVASLVAPKVVPPTALRRLPLDSLSGVADQPTRRWLSDSLRVLNDGKVTCALTLLPTGSLARVNLADLAEGRPAAALEARLVSKEPVPENERELVAAYQSLLLVDALVMNTKRREVRVDRERGTVLAVDDNDVFPSQGVSGAVGDAFNRLARHLTFSKRAVDRLRALERDALQQALTADGGTLLVTPKQVGEILGRRAALLRTVDQRIKQRGADRALGLP